jgi:hypothetical protein
VKTPGQSGRGSVDRGQAMAITYFVALPFDVADGSVVVGEPIECLSPAADIPQVTPWKTQMPVSHRSSAPSPNCLSASSGRSAKAQTAADFPHIPASSPHAPISAATVCDAVIDKRKSNFGSQLESILPMLIICEYLVFFFHLSVASDDCRIGQDLFQTSPIIA